MDISYASGSVVPPIDCIMTAISLLRALKKVKNCGIGRWFNQWWNSIPSFLESKIKISNELTRSSLDCGQLFK